MKITARPRRETYLEFVNNGGCWINIYPEELWHGFKCESGYFLYNGHIQIVIHEVTFHSYFEVVKNEEV